MKKIYDHIDYTRVGYFQSILEAEGIATHLNNLGVSSLTSVITTGQGHPELWVVRDADYAEAVEILTPHLNFSKSGAKDKN